MRRLIRALLATCFAAACAAPAHAALRVCMSPDNLPFSNRAGQGFENHLARLIGQAMNTRIEYVWKPERHDLVDKTLEVGACDVLMALPTRSDDALTTIPYYRSTYVMIYRRSAPFQLKSINDPRLRRLTIGVHAIGDDIDDLPPGAVLARRGITRNLVLYRLFGDATQPPDQLIKDVANGKLDVAIAWGPPAGYFAAHQPVKLAVVPVTDTHAMLPFQYSISLAVRKTDRALRDRLNHVLRDHRGAIRALLTRYHVPLVRPLAAGDATARVTAANRRQL